MRRILRRYVTRDSAGRPISIQSERLTDDGAGRLQLNNERTARSCYPTRPSSCVGFPVGGGKCTQLRAWAGLPPLQDRTADGSMIYRLTAELRDYAEE